MISRVKAILAALAAILAFSALAAGSASAAQWFVNGTALKEGSTVAFAATAAVDRTEEVAVPSLGLKIACGGPVLVLRGVVIPPNKDLEERTYHSCALTQPSTCSLSSTLINWVIKTEEVIDPLSQALQLASPDLGGKTLGTLTFEGSCAFAGEQPVNGDFDELLPTGQTESVTQALEGIGTTENNSLEIVKDKAYLTGKMLVKLSSGLSWSFH